MRLGGPTTRRSLLMAAVCLTALNIYGLTVSLRDTTGLQSEPGRMDLAVFEQAAERLPGEQPSDYAVRLNDLVHRTVAHGWSGDGLNMRVPVYENYVLYLAGLLFPDRFGSYEFFDYAKAVDRGVGLCSQQAAIVVQVLSENGIGSGMVGLSGHVVATARVETEPDTWWILDPDYGVVVQADLAQVEADPERVRAAYVDRGLDHATVERLVAFYGPEGNRSADTVAEYWGWARRIADSGAYLLIWILPMALAAPELAARWWPRRPVEESVR